jgi:hypothetical protein
MGNGSLLERLNNSWGNRTMENLEQLFIKYNVPRHLSLMAKVETLIVMHDCDYDMILKLYKDYK